MPQIITNGTINWNNGSYSWGYRKKGKRYSKTMKTREAIEKYRDNKLREAHPIGGGGKEDKELSS